MRSIFSLANHIAGDWAMLSNVSLAIYAVIISDDMTAQTNLLLESKLNEGA